MYLLFVFKISSFSFLFLVWEYDISGRSKVTCHQKVPQKSKWDNAHFQEDWGSCFRIKCGTVLLSVQMYNCMSRCISGFIHIINKPTLSIKWMMLSFKTLSLIAIAFPARFTQETWNKRRLTPLPPEDSLSCGTSRWLKMF